MRTPHPTRPMHRSFRLALTSLTLAAGCYSVEPLATTPTPGTRLAISLNDGGRVALGGAMGPEIRRVDGNLMAKQDSEYVVSVTGVNYLNGTSQAWQGETVRINTSMVAGLQERKFSKGRTIALVGAVALFAGSFKTFGLPWSGREEPPEPPTGSESSRRPYRPFVFRVPR
jgi:hypothetical protein